MQLYTYILKYIHRVLQLSETKQTIQGNSRRLARLQKTAPACHRNALPTCRHCRPTQLDQSAVTTIPGISGIPGIPRNSTNQRDSCHSTATVPVPDNNIRTSGPSSINNSNTSLAAQPEYLAASKQQPCSFNPKPWIRFRFRFRFPPKASKPPSLQASSLPPFLRHLPVFLPPSIRFIISHHLPFSTFHFLTLLTQGSK